MHPVQVAAIALCQFCADVSGLRRPARPLMRTAPPDPARFCNGDAFRVSKTDNQQIEKVSPFYVVPGNAVEDEPGRVLVVATASFVVECSTI